MKKWIKILPLLGIIIVLFIFSGSRVSTNVPISADEIQTVSIFSFTGKDEAATLLSVISNDREVAYIEAGVEPDIERKAIQKGERISFLFSFSEQVESLNATAFNEEGKALYY